MSRHIKLIAQSGTDVSDKDWKSFCDMFRSLYEDKSNLSGGYHSEYIESEGLYIGRECDINYFIFQVFKDFMGSNIYLQLWYLDENPDETHTL